MDDCIDQVVKMLSTALPGITILDTPVDPFKQKIFPIISVQWGKTERDPIGVGPIFSVERTIEIRTWMGCCRKQPRVFCV